MSKKQKTYLEDQGKRIEFDAVFLIEHTSRLEISDSPSDGEEKTDRVTVAADEVSLEIGVSDCNASKDEKQRAVDAFRKMKDIQRSRRPVTLGTRFYKYTNMLPESITTSDDVTTMNVWKATILLKELLPYTATSIGSSGGSSSGPHKTDTTSGGDTTGQAPDSSILAQLLSKI